MTARGDGGSRVQARVTFDGRVYALPTIKKAAYRLLKSFDTQIAQDGDTWVCTLNFPATVNADAVRQAERELLAEVLDQDLRASIARETEPLRNAILALASRTRYQRLANFTALHIFVVSLRCEHSCPYCQVSRQSDDRVAFDMTRETATKALDLVFRSPSPTLKIEFQGGEPLLNLDLVRFIVELALEKNREAKRDLQFVIASNLALLTDEVLEFCKAHHVL